MTTPPPDWIAADWGTSNLRLWAMAADGKVLAHASGRDGMRDLAPNQFEGVLLDHINVWLGDGTAGDTARGGKPLPVIACGMVGARTGWAEAPYAETPAPPAGDCITVATGDTRIAMHIISGMCQSDPADVMRGEETQLAGLLAASPGYDGAVCLPGTHSKWVMLGGGKVLHFRTAMTGELHEVIAQHSILRHGIGAWDDDAFLEAAHEALAAPAKISMQLFGIRARNLLRGNANGVARISGALIGLELAGAEDYRQSGKPITIIGAGELARLYALALESIGSNAKSMDAETMTLDGLRKVYKKMHATKG